MKIDEFKKYELGSQISILRDRGIIDYIGPTCYTTLIGRLHKVGANALVLKDVEKYYQIVQKQKWMPYVPALSLGPPKSDGHLEEVVLCTDDLRECRGVEQGIFFDWMK
jgi:hypothetical protein